MRAWQAQYRAEQTILPFSFRTSSAFLLRFSAWNSLFQMEELFLLIRNSVFGILKKKKALEMARLGDHGKIVWSGLFIKREMKQFNLLYRGQKSGRELDSRVPLHGIRLSPSRKRRRRRSPFAGSELDQNKNRQSQGRRRRLIQRKSRTSKKRAKKNLIENPF